MSIMMRITFFSARNFILVANVQLCLGRLPNLCKNWDELLQIYNITLKNLRDDELIEGGKEEGVEKLRRQIVADITEIRGHVAVKVKEIIPKVTVKMEFEEGEKVKIEVDESEFILPHEDPLAQRDGRVCEGDYYPAGGEEGVDPKRFKSSVTEDDEALKIGDNLAKNNGVESPNSRNEYLLVDKDKTVSRIGMPSEIRTLAAMSRHFNHEHLDKMPISDGFSNSRKTGTRHILQDLLHSTVLLNRSNVIPPSHDQHSDKFPIKIETNYSQNFPLKIEEHNSSPEFQSCSICSESTNLRPLALQEMEILAKFVLSQEQISLILQTEDHPPIFCCKICSSAILSLAKLTTQIENITISLRAVISCRNGLFNKLRNKSKISEVSRVTAADSGDNRHDSNVANSDVDSKSKFVCKICQPNVTFSRNSGLLRHLRSKKIHLRSKKIHRNVSEAVIPGRIPIKCPRKSCPAQFATWKLLIAHARLDHFMEKCDHCDLTFTSAESMNQHKNEFHKRCEICGLVFLKSNFSYHSQKCRELEAHGGKKVGPVDSNSACLVVTKSVTPTGLVTYDCGRCSVKNLPEWDFLRHVRLHQ